MPPAPPDRLKSVLVEALRPYASRIELFGSVARGEANDESDLDVLVTLRAADDRPSLGLKWFELERHLSSELGRPVELVTEKALSAHLRSDIDPDRLLLYEDE
jgi:predicted nucleotidyltransferase